MHNLPMLFDNSTPCNGSIFVIIITENFDGFYFDDFYIFGYRNEWPLQIPYSSAYKSKKFGQFFTLKVGRGQLICGSENIRSAITIVVYIS